MRRASPRRDGRAPPRLPPIPRAPLLAAGDPPRFDSRTRGAPVTNHLWARFTDFQREQDLRRMAFSAAFCVALLFAAAQARHAPPTATPIRMCQGGYSLPASLRFEYIASSFSGAVGGTP